MGAQARKRKIDLKGGGSTKTQYIGVLIELGLAPKGHLHRYMLAERPAAGNVYHDIVAPEYVNHPTVRGIVAACKGNEDATVSLELGKENCLSAEVPARHADSFVRHLNCVPGVVRVKQLYTLNAI